jgi:hypothetical protein
MRQYLSYVTVDKAQIGSAIFTALGALVAAFALVLSYATLDRSTEQQANIGASDALQEHFSYAAERKVWIGQDPETQEANMKNHEAYTSVALHGLYTANFIYDLTEPTDETRSWRSTAEGLLKQYEQPLRRSFEEDDSRCEDFDQDFLNFAREVLGRGWCRSGVLAPILDL